MSLLRDDRWFAPRFGWTKRDYDEACVRATEPPPPAPRPPTPTASPRDAAAAFLAALTPDAWMADAACRGAEIAIFFPERGDDVRPALALCARCPVRDECAGYAAQFGPTLHGIWAGTTGRARSQRRAVAVDDDQQVSRHDSPEIAAEPSGAGELVSLDELRARFAALQAASEETDQLVAELLQGARRGAI